MKKCIEYTQIYIWSKNARNKIGFKGNIRQNNSQIRIKPQNTEKQAWILYVNVYKKPVNTEKQQEF